VKVVRLRGEVLSVAKTTSVAVGDKRREARASRGVAQQAEILRLAISNYRSARKLMMAWEDATERVIAVETSRS